MPVLPRIKNKLNEYISLVPRVTLHVILYGDEDLNLSDNEKIFAANHTYCILVEAEDLLSTTMTFFSL